MTSLIDRAKSLQKILAGCRRHLHRHPEPSYREFETASYLAREVAARGYSVRENQGGTGVVADLVRNPEADFVLLRADMDSLPIREESGLPFASERAGQAHLCGHDAHCAMVLGAADLLADPEINPDTNVRIAFQSAEEIPPGGAIQLIESGVLEKVSRAYALHVDPRLPTGTFGCRPGQMMAAVNEFSVTIEGKGGHAAYPHLTADPVVAAARCIVRLQEIVSRNLPPFVPGVVSVCEVKAGETFNVIPDRASFRGTTRFYEKKWVQKAEEWIRRVVEGCCHGTGCRGFLDFREGYPPLVNDPYQVEQIRKTIASLWGEEAYREVEIQGGGEDFARFLERVPGAMVFIGIRNESLGSVHFLHNPRFILDEECLWRGTALLTRLAVEGSK